MSPTVYVITKGIYSSYRIVTILGTKMLAEEFTAHDPDLHIEPYEVDILADQIAGGYCTYNVHMDKYGDGRAWVNADGPFEDLRVVNRPRFPEPGDKLVLWGCIWAKSEQHALKIANERRVRLIEAGEWRVKPKRPRKKSR